MKKAFLFLTLLFVSLTLAACHQTGTTTDPNQLPAPTGIAVVDNILTFDAVEGAVAYELSAQPGEGSMQTYPIVSGADLSLLLPYGSYSVSVRALAGPDHVDSAFATAISADVVDAGTLNLLEGTMMNDTRYVKWLGRTRYDETEGIRYVYYTASGFEVGFYGTTVSATFTAQNTDDLAKRPYIVVFTDGEENPVMGRPLSLKAATSTVVLVQGLPLGYHTVKVLKRSEALDGDIGVSNFSTDGHFSAPAEVKGFRILFIGDSSMTGYGDLSSSAGNAKTTANSDGLMDFAYLTTYIHDAEASIVAASGWGVTRGWNTSGALDAVANIPNAFDYVAIDGTGALRTDFGTWDPNAFVPDVIVLTLGTNDFNASGYDSMDSTAKAALSDRFVADYAAFLVRLGTLYPEAPIIVAWGLMGDDERIGAFEQAAVDLANETLAGQVHALLMPAAGEPYGYGSDYHPQAVTHVEAARLLADTIATLTGHDLVHTEIVGW